MQRKFYFMIIIMISVSIIFVGCDSSNNSVTYEDKHYLSVFIKEGSGTIREDGQKFEDGEIVSLSPVEEDWKIKDIVGDGVTQENGEWKVLMEENRHLEVYLEKKKYEIETETNLPDSSAVMVTVSEEPSDFDGSPSDIDPLNPPHGTVIRSDARTAIGNFYRWEKDAVEYGSMNPIYITVEEDLFLRAVFSVGSVNSN